MFINLVFCLGSDRPSGLLSFMPALLLYSRLSSYLLRLSLFISFLLFPCASVSENTLAWVNFVQPYWMVLPFILSLVQEKLNMPSKHFYRHGSWSGRSSQLIKKYIYLWYKLTFITYPIMVLVQFYFYTPFYVIHFIKTFILKVTKKIVADFYMK